jgi:hypothetical protein
MGQYKYPDAHFHFYNCYNFSFNPSGIIDLPIPDLSENFDLIISYSIFTHTSKSEMIDRVTALVKMLHPGGKLLFTFIDPDYNPHLQDKRYRSINNFELRLRRLNNGYLNKEFIEQVNDAEWSLLLNKDDLYVEDEDHRHYELENRATYFSFFKSSFIQKTFPSATILPPPLHAYPHDYEAELQHTCMIHKSVI